MLNEMKLDGPLGHIEGVRREGMNTLRGPEQDSTEGEGQASEEDQNV